MNRYQLFLLQQGKIVMRYEFNAENDEHACAATALVFDACTDGCDDFELWAGVRLVTRRASWKARAIIARAANVAARADDHVATLEEAIERIAVTIEEAAMEMSDALRASPRLNLRLSELRRTPPVSR